MNDFLFSVIFTGGHAGHSAKVFCPRCPFEASVCGCKSSATEPRPGIPDNLKRRHPEGLTVLSSGVIRPKRPGEHLVYRETSVVPRTHFRDEVAFRASQFRIHRKQMSPNATKASVERIRKINGVSSFSLLNLWPPSMFKITQDCPIDA